MWKVSVSLKTANKYAGTRARAIKEATHQAYLSKYDALNKDALHNRASTHTRKPLFVYFEAVEREKEGKKSTPGITFLVELFSLFVPPVT